MSALPDDDIEDFMREIDGDDDETGTCAGLPGLENPDDEDPTETGTCAGLPDVEDTKPADPPVTDIDGESVETSDQTGTSAGLPKRDEAKPADPPVTTPKSKKSQSLTVISVSRHTAEVETIIADLTPGWHPIAMAWPTLGPTTLKLLCDHLRTHGLIYPIKRYEGLVLAGRNREIGCRITGIVPRYEDYKGDDPVGFAIGENEARRQTLSESQRAMVAARLANLGPGQKAGRGGKPADPPVTQATAAKSQGVGERTARAARKILRKAPKLALAVDTGKLSVDAGEKLADEPAAVQEAVAEQLDQGVDAKTAITKVVPELKAKKPKATHTPKPRSADAPDIVETTAQLYMRWTPGQRQRFHARLAELEKIEAEAQPLS
jgi:hypothetical protein